MKAITTHYIPPTNFKGSRVAATAEGGPRKHRVTIDYNHASHDPHREAAVALCQKLGWTGKLIEGGLPNGDHVFVFLPHDLLLASKNRVSADVIDLASPEFLIYGDNSRNEPHQAVSA